MLNSFAKEYKDEYTYTDKFVSIIKNENYKIIIFKDFDCVNQFGLGIPDLRKFTNRLLQENEGEIIETQTSKEDSCYTKIQKNLDIEENLIVVYIEDNNNIISEKGYILYNPITGGKINYENICNDNELTKIENKTVDDDSSDNLLKYIYLRPESKNEENEENKESEEYEENEELNICPEGYAPFYKKDKDLLCLNSSEKYIGLYYDSHNDIFLKCYENCKYCDIGGTYEQNNCNECAEGYVPHPKESNKNQNFSCVLNCTYSYFFDQFDKYTCTSGPSCPDDHKFYIQEKNQCIDSCKNDDLYQLTYNGNCMQKCPDGLSNDTDGYCRENNNSTLKMCTLSKKEAKLKNYNDETDLNILVKNYFEEFNYTDKHVSEFNSKDNYDITIYIDSNCLTELNLNFPNIDFGSCYQKVQNETGINSSLIVVLVKVLNKTTGRTSSSYSLYSPLDGSKLDALNICKDIKIVVESNILNILEESNIDYEDMILMTEQNINIFDSKDAFYTDICFEFDSPIKRDITLEDRLKTFYPNVSLCDEGCSSKGVNLTTMKAICSCTFNDISKATGNANELIDDYIKIISSSNIEVLTCIKYSFKKFDTSVGGFLMIFCIVIVVLMGLSFYFKDLKILNKYIIDKTAAYLNFLNEVFLEEDKKTNIIINSSDSKINDSKSESDSKIKFDSKSKSQNKQTSEVDIVEQQQESSERKENILVLNKINNSKEPFARHIISNKLKDLNKVSKITNYIDPVYKEDFNEYLAPDFDDLEFEDIIKQDKRTFKEFFFDSLNDKQLFINTFYEQDNFRPKSLKIIFFILNLILYCVINALFIGEETISKIYHIEGKDPYFGFFTRAITRYIYSAFIGVIIDILIDLFFISEKKMKSIFIKEKKNIGNLKTHITKLSREMIKLYISFIIFVIVLFILIMLYLLCFNYVYPHTQKEWVKSSILLIIIIQIISILVALFQTIFRFIGIALKNEKIFRISKLLD